MVNLRKDSKDQAIARLTTDHAKRCRDWGTRNLYRVELMGARARQDRGPSFARAFVAGMRQAGYTAPLVAR